MLTSIFFFLCTIGIIKHKSTSIPIGCAKRVQRCPVERSQWVQKTEQLKCATDYGYVCLRDLNGYLFETCMANFAIQANLGNCPILFACLNNNPLLGTTTTFYHCPMEVSGCPPENHTQYSIHQLYKYPKCVESNFSDAIGNTSSKSTTSISMTTLSTSHIIELDKTQVIIVVLVFAVLVTTAGFYITCYYRETRRDIESVIKDIEYPRERNGYVRVKRRDIEVLLKGGMDLRKGHSVHALPFHELKDLHQYNIQSSVGIVYAKDSKSNMIGTGFLITNNYVVTAFHVVEDIFFHVWLDILDALQNYDSGIESIEKAKKIKSKEFEKDSILRCLQNVTISQVKENLKEKKEKDKIQRIEDTFYDTLWDGISFEFRIVFNMVHEEDSGNPYNFSLDTKYISVDDDIVILTLLDTNGLPSRPLHISAEISDLNKEFDIYGYPYPYKMLLVDQKCKALSRKDVKWICHTGGKKFFKDLRKEKKIKGIKLADYNIRHDSYYFHCTATMYHGASGAPGIIYKPDERTGAVYPTVVCMLIRGHPRFVFRSHMLNVHLDDKACLKYLIEEGATFKNCLKFLSEPTHLRNSSVIDAEEGSSEPLMSDKWKSTKQRQRPNSEPAYSNISESVRKIQRHFSDPGDRPDIDFEIDGQDKYVSFDERTDRLPYIPLTRVQIDTIKHE